MKAISDLLSSNHFPDAQEMVPKQTEEQILAIEIAEHLGEKVGLWIGIIRRAKIKLWYVRAKFEELKKQNELETKSKARILMAFIRNQNRM